MRILVAQMVLKNINWVHVQCHGTPSNEFNKKRFPANFPEIYNSSFGMNIHQVPSSFFFLWATLSSRPLSELPNLAPLGDSWAPDQGSNPKMTMEKSGN